MCILQWLKPFAGSSVTLDATGAFTFTGWASSPATDKLVTQYSITILPLGTPVINGELPIC